MEYQNRQPKEGINTTRVHPLKQFFQLAIAALVLVVGLVVVLQFTGSALAKHIPFSFELEVMEKLDLPLGSENADPRMAEYLNELGQRISAHLPMPEGMQVTIHYSNDDVFNAFATVGGNLLFYKGLLSSMPNENALAMVMAHEISHVLHRDPVAALGGGVVSTVALLGLTGNAGTGMAGRVLSNAGMVTGMQFTRKMEVAADYEALAAVNALYGHVNGAADLFELFKKNRGQTGNAPAWAERFISTHPLDDDRIDAITDRAKAEAWQQEGLLTPLPAEFRKWM
ncbi:MAG: M48 family metallopeptidase [Granulosicoccus sp.]